MPLAGEMTVTLAEFGEKKQIGIIKVQHEPCKFISLLFFYKLHSIHIYL